MINTKVLEALMLTAEIYGREFKEHAARMFAADLEAYSADAILKALSRCRRELRTFPSVADIITRIDDGRPGPEEAWAMVPKSEHESVVWTDEMRNAFGVVRHQLEEDPIGARMAFREVYQAQVARARDEHRAVRWEASLGFEATGRQVVLREAIEKGRISQSYANALLPEPMLAKVIQIAGPQEPELSPIDPVEMIARIRESIQKPKTGDDPSGQTPSQVNLKRPSDNNW